MVSNQCSSSKEMDATSAFVGFEKKRDEQYASVFHIPPPDSYNLEDEAGLTEGQLNDLTKKVKSVPGWKELRDGDAIQVGGWRYCNDGTYFWDSGKVVEMATDLDTYGNVLSKWTYPTFPSNYWKNVTQHNSWFWVELFDLLQTAEEKAGPPSFIEDEDEDVRFVCVNYKDKTIYVVQENIEDSFSDRLNDFGGALGWSSIDDLAYEAPENTEVFWIP